MAVGFAPGDAVMVTIEGERRRARFVAEVDEGYEVEVRTPNGKRYLSPQVFVHNAVDRPTDAELLTPARPGEKRERKPGAPTKWDHRVEVMLKKASIGKVAAGLGIEFTRQDLPLDQADESLREARISCRLSVEPDQEELFEGTKPELVSVADVGRLSVGGGTITATLSFRRDDVDVDALADFAQKNATLDFSRVGDRDPKAATVAQEGEAE